MGLEEVKNEILQEAEEKSDRIVEEAEAEAKEILEEAEKEAEKIIKEAEEEIEEQKESIEKKALSNARMKARQEKQRKKQQKLDETFKEFREQLSEMEDSDREAFVENCVEKSGFEVDRVKGSPGFQDAAEELGLEFEETDEEGLVLESADGERSMDFTFDMIVSDMRENQRKEVARRLFE